MTNQATFKVRCRAFILHEGKLLVVKHQPESDYYALPGGHMEPGESALECVQREILEEFGIEPVLGRLLYIHTFEDKNKNEGQTLEFFFEVLNGSDFLSFEDKVRTHAFELAEIRWTAPEDGLTILPNKIAEDFTQHALLSGEIRYIKG